MVFSFGRKPLLKKRMTVNVVPPPASVDGATSDEEDDPMSKFKNMLKTSAERWTRENSSVVDFEPPIWKHEPEDEPLLARFPHPQPNAFQPGQETFEAQATAANYRRRMHDLLYIEEMAQFDQLSEFNVGCTLLLTKSYVLASNVASSSTAKYARPGELFGKMTLGSNLSEDTPAGRLILTNCSLLLLTVTGKPKGEGEKPTRYVSAIEDRGKNEVYLRLSEALVNHHALKPEGNLEVEVQFQLNRVPVCEMHSAVDALSEIDLVFPNVDESHAIPWSPGKQWDDGLSAKLNPKQKEAILAITAPLSLCLPPILLIGPYGTGKTFTMGQAIKVLLKQSKARVLVCTHSNSAADLYIREYLHPFIEANPEVKLLRIYYKNRWVKTVHQTVQRYCLITKTENERFFHNPTLEDVLGHDIVVATLSTSRYLGGIGLPKNHFTHILIDEAAQAMECEALMPLGMIGGVESESASSSRTRVVLAGDHMQLSPEVFSPFALERNLNKSLLERLYHLYPADFPCKIMLCENYRSHEAIIKYTSDLFYDQKLLASGRQPAHGEWHPLTLFSTKGEDMQDVNSTSFYNDAEVYEVVTRVADLQQNWPKAWGHRDENSIGVVTPYYDQVMRIRSELKKRKMFGISVERVLNVQGKQFRVIFLSTVRTRKSCIHVREDLDECDFGFLSNDKLLNTAITRAQSLVAVVGDPLALATVGKCRKLWERFINTCLEHKSAKGLSKQVFHAMLTQVDLKKTYFLNPFAKEFVPKARSKTRDSFLAYLPKQYQPRPTGRSASKGALPSPANASAPLAYPYPQQLPPPTMPDLPFRPPMNPYMAQQPLFAYAHPPPASPAQHLGAAAAAAAAGVPPPLSLPSGAAYGNQQHQIAQHMAAVAALSAMGQWNKAVPPVPPPPPPLYPMGVPGHITPPPSAAAAVVAAAAAASVLQRPPSTSPLTGYARPGAPVTPPMQLPPFSTAALGYGAPPVMPGVPMPYGAPVLQRPPPPSMASSGAPTSTTAATPESTTGTSAVVGSGQQQPVRQPNPSFANSRYQRAATSDGPSTRRSDPTVELLVDRIHIPKTTSKKPSGGGGGSSGPSGKRGGGGLASHMDYALKLLPDDVELTEFLKVPSFISAWLVKVEAEKGPEDAALLRELIEVLGSNPDVAKMHEANKREQKAVKSPPSSGGAIRAEDLEALMMNEERERGVAAPRAAVQPTPPSPPDPLRNNAVLDEILGTGGDSNTSLNELLERSARDEEEEPASSSATARGPEQLLGLYNLRPDMSSRAGSLQPTSASSSTVPPLPLPTFPNRLGSNNRSASLTPSNSFGLSGGANMLRESSSCYPGGSSASSNAPLRYSDVLRAPQQQQQRRQRSGSDVLESSDPLTRIRDIGTRGNTGDSGTNSFGGFGRW